MEALILVGGFGTRLKTIIQDIPKPMAPVRGKPFLEYILHSLCNGGISGFVFCVGYKHDIIEHYFGSSFKGLPITYSLETEPLGTGGALLQGLSLVKEEHCVVVNGDSFFAVDLNKFMKLHMESRADFTIALKKMYNFDRYGTVTVVEDRIVSFAEKKFCKEGLINGGVYIIKKDLLLSEQLPRAFSLEKDFLEKRVSNSRIFGKIFDGYFIDIGIPEDYERAQGELPIKN